MAEQFTEYVCINCGGSIRFDAASGKMKCDFCDSMFDLEEVKAYYAQENQKNADQDGSKAAESSWGEELQSMRAYSCQACGAELVCDETTAATSCPYCGNVAIIPQQFKGMMRPRYVIPFKVDKEQAKDKLTGYCRGKRLLPKSFTQNNHIDEIKGLYVPFWMYSGTVDAATSYEAKKEEARKTSTEIIRTTNIYDVKRRGGVSYQMIPTDASSSMPDDLMDSIEPFDYSGIKDFEMEYLVGFMADKYDVSQEESKTRARSRAENTTLTMLRETVKDYDHVNERTTERQIHFLGEKQEYAMLPVWLLSTKWNSENFLFAINGQTGKMTGNLPVDKKKKWLYILLAAIPMFLIGCLIGQFQTNGFLIGAVMALVGGIIMNVINMGSMKPVAEKRTAANYVGSGDGGGSPLKLSVREDHFVNAITRKEPINRQ